MSEADFSPQSAGERRALAVAFLLNVAVAISLGVAGFMADSSGLLANAVDNASDAAVYAMSYYAVNRGAAWKARAARVSGVMLLVLCALVVADVARRLIVGAEPASMMMMVMTMLAAIVNLICLRVLRAFRHADINLRAAWTFSVNDLLSNLGVLLAGMLVAILGRSWPDLVVGLAIAVVAARGGLEILADASRTTAARSERSW